MTSTKRVNLALQGGGSHGAFTWGVLDALIEDGRLALVDLLVLGMAVPAGERDFHTPHAHLDQPSRGQTAPAEGGVSVSIAQALGFVADIEGLDLRRVHHGPGGRDGSA